MLEEMIELIDGDRSIGAGILVGSPLAYAYMSLGLAVRERARLEEAEELFAKALRIAEEDGDPETACWVTSNQAYLVALRGDVEEGLELSRRSLESTERLGDVFSRTVATVQPRRRPADGGRSRVGTRVDRGGGADLPRGDARGRRDAGLAGRYPLRSADRGRQGR